MKKTTARLRKTFHYPEEDDSDDSLPEVLDEQEQSTLISTLSTTNAQQNQQFTYLFLALPLLSIIPYLSTLFSRNPSQPNTFLLSLLSITSLLSTAYLLHTLPPSQTGIPLLDDLHHHPSAPTQPLKPTRREKGQRYQAPEFAPRSFRQTRQQQTLENSGPLLQYLPMLNIGLCAVLVGLGVVTYKVPDRREGDGGLWWGFSWLPGFMYAVVLGAKWVMGGVDPDEELGGLRYRFKGV